MRSDVLLGFLILIAPAIFWVGTLGGNEGILGGLTTFLALYMLPGSGANSGVIAAHVAQEA